MRMITVKSDHTLTQAELETIQGIFHESKCPNESLISSVDGCTGFHDGEVTIGAGDTFVAHVEI